MNKGKTQEELKEEMFEDWLWKEWYDELYSQAIKEIEKEVGFWKSAWGCSKQINERHNELFGKKLNELN